MNDRPYVYDESPNKVRVKSRRRSRPNTDLVAIKWFSIFFGISFGIFLPFAVAAVWPTKEPVKTPPTDQQLDQVVLAVQALSTHYEPVIRGRQILRTFLYRWGN